MAEGVPGRLLRARHLQRSGCLLALALVCWAPVDQALAQRVPLNAGSTVRLAPADSAAQVVWRTGTVLTATRLGVLVRASDPPGDTVPVPLNGSVRIQVKRHVNRSVLLGGGLGVVLGGVLGGTLLHSTFGASWGDPSVAGEVVGFGLLGGLTGAGVGLLARSVRWDEIPLTSRGFPIAPLTRATRQVPLTKRERWQAFPPTEGDFAAFFAHWEDSLEVVEGVWELEDVSGPAGTTARFLAGTRTAIVRDGRYEGYDYVAVRLALRGGTIQTRDVGVIIFAMRQGERPGFFEMRYTSGSERSGSHLVEFRDGELEFRYGAEPTIERWVKLVRSAP